MTGLQDATAVLVRCTDVWRTFGTGETALDAVSNATCAVSEGEQIVITGPSGSGKSTLLNLMAGLDRPSSGEIEWPAIGSIEALRPGPVAIVFQGPSLIPSLTVLENVALVCLLNGVASEQAQASAQRALELLGLETLNTKLPEEVSGGQAQRIAIARALAGKPRLILADEPTGQLDRANATRVIDALQKSARASGAALITTTHDPLVAERFPMRWSMAEGILEVKEDKECSV
jgi:putative ABC transport system ATP-binding protein/lipoprotein-releasing system ATP-binding protein